MKNKEDMDLRAVKPREPFYNRSSILRFCNRCGGEHPVFYRKYVNGKIALAMACRDSKPRTQFIRFEPNLDIPLFGDKKQGEIIT